MDKNQLNAIDIAAKALVNRFGAIELKSITNKIHPDLKGVKALSIHKVLKETESSEYIVKDDILKIIYFDITYDRTNEVLKAKNEYKQWDVISWDDIKDYQDTYDLPLCEKALQMFNYCCSINKDLIENKQLFAFRFSNYVNTHKIIAKCSITKFLLEPFNLPTWDIELEALIIEAIYNQSSWLCYGRCRNERIRYAWVDKAFNSVDNLNEKDFEKINQLAQAATNFYGIISIKNFQKLIKIYYKDIKISRDELDTLFSNYEEESNIYYLNKNLVTDRIYDWSFDLFKDESIRKIDPEGFDAYINQKDKQTAIVQIDTNLITQYIISSIKKLQENKKFLVLKKEDLLKYLDLGYLKETENYLILENIYKSFSGRYSNNITRFKIIFNRYANCPGDNAANMIRHFILASKFAQNDDDNIEKYLITIQKAFNEAPRWINNGFSALEVKSINNQ